MNTRRTSWGIAVIMVIFWVGTSSAALLTFDQSQLLNFDVVDSSLIGFNNGTNWTFAGSPYSGSSSQGVFYKGTTDYGSSYEYSSGGTTYYIGAIGADADTLEVTDGSDFDKFSIGVKNWNNYSWYFASFAVLNGEPFFSPIKLTTPGAPNTGGVAGSLQYLEFELDPGYTILSDDIFGVAFALAGGGGDTAHFELVPALEPGTMLLLGSGLVGLAGWGRKKFRK